MLKFFGMQKRKPKTFDYKPRFYDAEKEALEARKKRIIDDDSEGVKMRLRQEFSSYRRSNKKGMGGFLRSSSLRILVIIGLLLFFGYMVLENYLPQMMEFWFPEEVEHPGEEFY